MLERIVKELRSERSRVERVIGILEALRGKAKPRRGRTLPVLMSPLRVDGPPPRMPDFPFDPLGYLPKQRTRPTKKPSATATARAARPRWGEGRGKHITAEGRQALSLSAKRRWKKTKKAGRHTL